MFQTNVVEKTKPKFNVLSFFYFAVYEIMWKDIAGTGRPQMTIWCMRIACWIPKATNRFLEYVILIAFPLQHWLREYASMLRYMYIACLVSLYIIIIHTAYC